MVQHYLTVDHAIHQAEERRQCAPQTRGKRLRVEACESENS